jgi:membrane protein YdbS with pleckstrin-like domain
VSAADLPANQPNPPELPVSVADGRVRTLDPRYIPLRRSVGSIVTAFTSAGLLVVLLIVLVTVRMPPGAVWLLPAAWVLASLALALFTWRWPVLAYRRTSYRVDPDGIEIRRGVWWRRVISVPRSRVQHIDVSQGPLERSYGLGTLQIFTAGTHYAHVGLDGLAHPTAVMIRDHLLPHEGDDAV